MRIAVVLVLPLLFLGACGRPSEEQVRREFLQLHPMADNVSARASEGDSDHDLWCITYRLPPDTILREQVWLYRRISSQNWSVVSRDSAASTDRLCERAA